MPIDLPLEEMTIEEKLQVMEALWADLTKNPEDFPSPAWHREVLDERERKVRDGEEQYVDWETAKKQLRDRFS